MKLTTETIRMMIREELQKITESQKKLGLPHKYTPRQLYDHVMGFIKMHPNLKLELMYDEELREKAEGLLTILNNAVRDSVQYDEGDYTTHKHIEGIPWRDATTPEETEAMLKNQDMLKLARSALGSVLGQDYRIGRGPRTSHISDVMRDLAKSGKLKPGMHPSDVPELRRNMPSYQKGGRFYDSNDPIHKK